jgi:hypothetical protein
MGTKLSPNSPATHAVLLVKSDSTVIPDTRGLYVGGAGNLNVVMNDGATALFTAVPVGTTLNISIKQLLDTSTTATAVLALY